MFPFSEWALGENKIIRCNQTSSFIPGSWSRFCYIYQSAPDIIGFRNRDHEGGFFVAVVILKWSLMENPGTMARLCRKNQGILAESFRHPEDNSSHYQWEGSVIVSHISQIDEFWQKRRWWSQPCCMLIRKGTIVSCGCKIWTPHGGFLYLRDFWGNTHSLSVMFRRHDKLLCHNVTEINTPEPAVQRRKGGVKGFWRPGPWGTTVPVLSEEVSAQRLLEVI